MLHYVQALHKEDIGMKRINWVRGISALAVILLFAGTVLGFSGVSKKTLPTAAKKETVVAEGIKNSAYAGSEACKNCHQKEHADWKETWHANMHRDIKPSIVKADFNNVEITYKEVEIETADKKKVKISPSIKLVKDGDKFTFTLIDKDNAANNQTYPVAYVLGGNWEQHFEAAVNGMYYATPMRWVMSDGQWRTKPFNSFWWIADDTPDGRPKKPEEMPKAQVGDAKCDACHTTGFKTSKDKASGKWTAVKSELGISCEMCHGPGSKHIATPSKENIVNPAKLNALQQNQLCGQCHSRVTNKNEKDLAFPQGFFIGNTDLHDRVEFWTYSTKPKNFWPNDFASKNRQQYHDIQKSKHQNAGVTCITCHDVHSPKKGYAQIRGDKASLCSSCHTASADMYKGSIMQQTGVNCTDCHMAKIANRAGSTKKTKEHWDTSSHTFTVVMPHAADDLKMRSSCDACHQGEKRGAVGSVMLKQQIEAKKKIEEVSAAISSHEKTGKEATKAKDLLNKILLDKSSGAHNYQKTMALLDEAMKSLNK
jgi:predicted CXXCH cytochrome family protein